MGGHLWALLKSRWPLARLLGQIQQAVSDLEEPWCSLQMPAISDFSHGLTGFYTKYDWIYPWVRILARAFQEPSMVYKELRWPKEAPSFTDVQGQALGLLLSFSLKNFQSPQNYGNSWR